uniref:uncharacterized protein isoform X3 n=1 Tax=Myxine glutinosa TaxID=7769 RepID=UPI00358EB952
MNRAMRSCRRRYKAGQELQAPLPSRLFIIPAVVPVVWLSRLSQLWVCLGSGKKMRDIPIHTLSAQLGPSTCLALPLFHAVTGCDTVSHFLGCGKKSAWSAWQSTPGLTDTLVALTSEPQELSPQSQHMRTLERFVLVMYSKGCGLERVNEARLRLFTSGKKTPEALPPTQAALYQHIRRAMLQASFFWSQATSVYQDIPDFHDWGWHKDSSGGWLPFWTTLEDSSKACSILLQCGCVKSCTGNCKCCRAGVRCTILCKCEDGHDRHDILPMEGCLPATNVLDNHKMRDWIMAKMKE